MIYIYIYIYVCIYNYSILSWWAFHIYLLTRGCHLWNMWALSGNWVAAPWIFFVDGHVPWEKLIIFIAVSGHSHMYTRTSIAYLFTAFSSVLYLLLCVEQEKTQQPWENPMVSKHLPEYQHVLFVVSTMFIDPALSGPSLLVGKYSWVVTKPMKNQLDSGGWYSKCPNSWGFVSHHFPISVGDEISPIYSWLMWNRTGHRNPPL